MKSRGVVFVGARQVEVRERELPSLAGGQLLVRSLLSAISPGTEMLVYRQQIPEELPLDESLSGLRGAFRYPLQYGYSVVGEVIDCGKDADPAWLGQHVFAFHPHESHFLADPGDLVPLPDAVSAEDAVFLPNTETAVNFLMDARPLVGEFAAVFGLGVVGLLTANLLAQFPLGGLVGFDRYALRRDTARAGGVEFSLDPADRPGWSRARMALRERGMVDGFDFACELSGAPAALDQAISLTGFSGRVLIGSWYGKKPVALDLGGRFHRSRIRLISSQVSSLAPELLGRWTKARRLGVAWDVLRRTCPSRWITQRFSVDQADLAYQHIDTAPEDTIQVVLEYPGE